MRADVRQLTQTALVFQRSAADAAQQMVRVVTRGALNVKRGWADNAAASSGRHAPHYPRAISYDVHPIPGGAFAEIGPDKSRVQGALGNLLEFGSVHNPPHNDGGRALQAEDPRFVAATLAVTLRMPWR
ncbi:hypothetical protein [Streptomyces lydicamycinicus]|uniref:hypothetical protein n=1 Tax=Streptomyces lydicamycinicus TaxID=1546107 RepID=UPI003C2FB4DF